MGWASAGVGKPAPEPQPWAAPFSGTHRKPAPPGLGAAGLPARALHPICATGPGELCPPNSGGSPRSLFLSSRGAQAPPPEPLRRDSGRGLGKRSSRLAEKGEEGWLRERVSGRVPAGLPGLPPGCGCGTKPLLAGGSRRGPSRTPVTRKQGRESGGCCWPCWGAGRRRGGAPCGPAAPLGGAD